MNESLCSICNISSFIDNSYKEELIKIMTTLNIEQKSLEYCDECCIEIIRDLRNEIDTKKARNNQNIDSDSNIINIKIVNEITETYKMVRDKFTETMSEDNYTIIRVEMNQNKYLYNKFNNCSVDMNFTYLFHGSNNNNYDNILIDGLKIEYSRNGLLGKGIYFSNHASYSSGYSNVLVTEKGKLKNMLLCRVKLGTIDLDYKILSSDKSIHCVYNNYQTYPEFIIYYVQL